MIDTDELEIELDLDIDPSLLEMSSDLGGEFLDSETAILSMGSLFSNAGARLYFDAELGESSKLDFSQHHTNIPQVDATDFEEGPERETFKLICTAARKACNVNTSIAERKRLLDWLFVPNTQGKYGIDYSLACQALGVREHVIRIRLMYELYRSAIILPEPLNFMSVSMPSSLESEILHWTGTLGYQIALTTWFWPGIRADTLMADFSHDIPGFRRELLSLESLGYCATTHGFWFFTGRNPDVMTPHERRHFSWSHAI